MKFMKMVENIETFQAFHSFQIEMKKRAFVVGHKVLLI